MLLKFYFTVSRQYFLLLEVKGILHAYGNLSKYSGRIMNLNKNKKSIKISTLFP
jgi:hypothetical protein